MGLFDWLSLGAPGAHWLVALVVAGGFPICVVADAISRAVRRRRRGE